MKIAGPVGVLARESLIAALFLAAPVAFAVRRMVERGLWWEAVELALFWPAVWFGLGVIRGWRERSADGGAMEG